MLHALINTVYTYLVSLTLLAVYIPPFEITDHKGRSVKVAAVLVQGHVPFALADQLVPLFKEIFPDSQIAAGYASKRT